MTLLDHPLVRDLNQIKNLLLKIVDCKGWHGVQHILCDEYCACPCNKPVVQPPPEGRKEWPDPTPEMLIDPTFEKIWGVIKTWDINVPHAYGGYCEATGNHARAILDAIKPPVPEPEKCTCSIHDIVYRGCTCGKPSPAVDPVEEKIQEIIEMVNNRGFCLGTPLLRELVALARKGETR